MIADDFVGRELEVAELQQHLNAALAGRGQVCFVTGEAGSGKSALVGNFLQRALDASPDLIVAQGSCNLQTGIGDPYLPFREVIGMLTGDVATTQSEGKVSPESRRRLRTVMVRSIQVLVEVAPELVGVFVPGAKLVTLVGKAMANKAGWMNSLEKLTKREAVIPAGTDPTADKSRIVEQFTRFIQELSVETPLVLFLDDLQWADAASINLLFHLGRQIEEHRVLIIGAYRPNDLAMGRDGNRHPLDAVIHELTRYNGDVCVELDEIPVSSARAFIDQLLDAEPNQLGRKFRDALFDQTGGHALFTVELIRAMRERGDLVQDDQGRWTARPDLAWQALPAKVEGVIAERIGRLDDDLRELLTVGSVEGEEFIAEVVARVETLMERETVRMLSNELQRRHGLVDARGMMRVGQVQLSLYRFVHSLFQQYLYNSLHEAERVYLHRDIGVIMEVLFADQPEEAAERLARHFEEAGLYAKAAHYRRLAGNKARRMSAYQEASAHLQHGLRLVAELPAGDERNKLELELQTALATSMIAFHGYASPEVNAVCERARELAHLQNDPHLTIPVLYGNGVYHLVRGEFVYAIEVGREVLDLAEQVGDTPYQMGAYLTIGAALFYQGALDEAREHLEKSMVPLDLPGHVELACIQGQDPHVAALAFLAIVYWLQGFPERALETKEASLSLARQIDHPYSLAFASAFAAQLFILMGMDEACATQARETLNISDGRFPMWEAVATNALGWVKGRRGDHDAAVAMMDEAVTIWESTGASTSITFLRTRLVDVYRLAGRREEGLALLDKRQHGQQEAWMVAEEHRLRANLLLMRPGHIAAAERVLRRALAVAETQGARTLALRVADDLAQVLIEQGKTAEAYDLLSRHYARFTEGFETPDLREARVLLARLERAGANVLVSTPTSGGHETTPQVLQGAGQPGLRQR